MLNNVIEYLKNSAKSYPDKIAFRDEKQSLTFAQIEQQSRILAYEIIAAVEGKTRQPIGIYLPKGVNCIVAFFAVAYSGNFYTPLDTSMPKTRLRRITDTLQPVVMITATAYCQTAAEVSTFAEIIDLDALSEQASDTKLLNAIQQGIIDTDPLYVMFTSGSTGMPKGVVVSHRSVIDYIEWLAATFHFSEKTIFGNQAPFYFDNSILDIYSTIRNGCETVIIPEERFLSSKRLCHYLDDQGINTIFWVPSALVLVANSGVLDTVCPQKLTHILFCGEVMPTKQLNIWRRALPEAIYANLYGPTEITDVCAYYIVEREFRDEESLPIGFACQNVEILVLNESDQAVRDNEIGELCVRGTCLAHGYYGNEEKTSVAFTQNPLNDKYPEKIYRTGDLVHYNGCGELIYVGRKDFQIKHMGHRIELGEIETAASSLHEIERCCALYDSEKNHLLLAVVPEEINKITLYQQLKTMLPRYMLPGKIESLSKLPLNPNGKIDRLKLLEILRDKEK